jgi:hypothetical protein
MFLSTEEVRVDKLDEEQVGHPSTTVIDIVECDDDETMNKRSNASGHDNHHSTVASMRYKKSSSNSVSSTNMTSAISAHGVTSNHYASPELRLAISSRLMMLKPMLSQETMHHPVFTVGHLINVITQLKKEASEGVIHFQDDDLHRLNVESILNSFYPFLSHSKDAKIEEGIRLLSQRLIV